MSPSIGEVRSELRALVERGVDLSHLQQTPPIDPPPRKSAVLILFGALDYVPAVAGVATVPPELDVLLMRRSDALRHHAGQVSFPGGGLEDQDEDLIATALREAAEETGLNPSGVEVIGSLGDAYLPVSNNIVTPVIGWWTHPSEVKADHSESVDVFRVPVADLLDPATRFTFVAARGGATFKGDAFTIRPQGHVLWGFTAMLLSGLFDELGWSVPWDKTDERAAVFSLN